MAKGKSQNSIITILIILISIAAPVIVTYLFFKPETNNGDDVNWAYILPHMNAVINGLTFLVLIIGYVFVKGGNIRMHRNCMTAAFVLGVLFLVSYLIFHYNTPTTIFGDSNQDGLLAIEEADRIGPMRLIYLAILLSHILLAAIVVPFILFTIYFAISDKIARHKQTVKLTLPVWLYVSISGLAVYYLVSPYYPG
jgi:putative membrane protein